MSYHFRIVIPVNLEPLLPNEKSKKEALIEILDTNAITNDSWILSRDKKSEIIDFNVQNEVVDKITTELSYKNIKNFDGCSVRYHQTDTFVTRTNEDPQIDSEQPSDQKSRLKHWFSNFLKPLSSQVTALQVYRDIDRCGQFTFTYFILLLSAALMALLALATNRSSVVVASMLLSPMMNPVKKTMFALKIRDRRMIKEALGALFLSMITCWIVGFGFGILAHNCARLEQVPAYPTPEMISRGDFHTQGTSVTLTVISGISMSVCMLIFDGSGLIGNAISLSILPPIVNSGLDFFLAVLSTQDYQISTNSSIPCYNYSWIKNFEPLYVMKCDDYSMEFVYQGLISLFLASYNIIIMISVGLLIIWLKNLTPLWFNQEERRFFKEDLQDLTDQHKTIKHDRDRQVLQDAYKNFMTAMTPDVGLNEETELVLRKQFLGVISAVTQTNHYQTMTGGNTSIANQLKRELLAPDVYTQLSDENLQGKSSLLRHQPVRRVQSLLMPMRPVQRGMSSPVHLDSLPEDKIKEWAFEELEKLCKLEEEIPPQKHTLRPKWTTSIPSVSVPFHKKSKDNQHKKQKEKPTHSGSANQLGSGETSEASGTGKNRKFVITQVPDKV